MAVTFKDLVNHPYSFAMGVGVANGLLAVGRGKKIDPPTAITLSVILGLGEMSLMMYEPESERPMPLSAIGVYSVLGVLTGLIPFISFKGSTIETEHGPIPLLASNASLPANQAVSGYFGSGRRGGRTGTRSPRRQRYA